VNTSTNLFFFGFFFGFSVVASPSSLVSIEDSAAVVDFVDAFLPALPLPLAATALPFFDSFDGGALRLAPLLAAVPLPFVDAATPLARFVTPSWIYSKTKCQSCNTTKYDRSKCLPNHFEHL
jgi:hypothetical protein